MDKLIGLLGICRRAGHAQVGFDAAADAIRKGKAGAVLLARDVSEKTAKEIRFAAEGKRTVVAAAPLDKAEMGHALGYEKAVGVVAVDDKGLSAAIIKLIQPNKEDEAHDQ